MTNPRKVLIAALALMVPAASFVATPVFAASSQSQAHSKKHHSSAHKASHKKGHSKKTQQPAS